MTACAFVGLGSNLDQPVVQIRRGYEALAALPESRLVAESPLYKNDAVGPTPQPPFVNGVAEIETTLSPHGLLNALLDAERIMGRRRDGSRWGPRTIDLDLLTHGDCEIQDDDLTLPHPEISRRRFVLLPLRDIAPDLVIPGYGPIDALLSQAPPHPMQRCSSSDCSLGAE